METKSFRQFLLLTKINNLKPRLIQANQAKTLAFLRQGFPKGTALHMGRS